MKTLENILAYIKFPEKYFNLNFRKSLNDIPDYQGIIDVESFNINEEFIEHFVYRRREKEEFWNSIDIYIQPLKTDEFLENILLKDKMDFKSMENNEEIFKLKIDNLTRLNIIKSDKKILIQITRFDDNNFA